MYRLMQRGEIVAHYSPAKPRTPYFALADIDSLAIPKEPAAARREQEARDKARASAKGCAVCGSNRMLCMHHVVPVDRGGADTIENMLPLCGGCHRSVHVGRTGAPLLKRARVIGTEHVVIRLLRGVGVMH